MRRSLAAFERTTDTEPERARTSEPKDTPGRPENDSSAADAAVLRWTEAIRRNPKSEWVYIFRGMAYLRKDQPRKGHR